MIVKLIKSEMEIGVCVNQTMDMGLIKPASNVLILKVDFLLMGTVQYALKI